VRGIAGASVSDLMKVEKIGKIKAERIHGVLNSGYAHEE